MGRPPKTPDEKLDKTYSVRLSDEQGASVELVRGKLQDEAPFANITTADAIRFLLATGTATATEILSEKAETSQKPFRRSYQKRKE